MKVVRKIQAKGLVGNVKDAEEGTLYTVVGKATGLKGGESNYGPWECLKGDFIAQTNDGEQYRGSQLFLPEIAHDMVAHQLKEGNEAVEFGFIIGKKNDETSAIGYVYTCEPLFQPEPESDPILKLAKTASDKVKQIESKK
jgi:hypothetical protein